MDERVWNWGNPADVAEPGERKWVMWRYRLNGSDPVAVGCYRIIVIVESSIAVIYRLVSVILVLLLCRTDKQSQSCGLGSQDSAVRIQIAFAPQWKVRERAGMQTAL